MKRPEKKEINVGDIGFNSSTQNDIGYNQACEEWEEYHEVICKVKNMFIEELSKQLDDLPSEKEIRNILAETMQKSHNHIVTLGEYALVISKRIGK